MTFINALLRRDLRNVRPTHEIPRWFIGTAVASKTLDDYGQPTCWLGNIDGYLRQGGPLMSLPSAMGELRDGGRVAARVGFVATNGELQCDLIPR